MSADTKMEIGPVRLQLKDGEKLASFISGLEPGSINEEFKENVLQVIQNLLTEFSDAVTDGHDNDLVLETLSRADKIVEALEYIGLGGSPAVSDIRTYAEHAKKGDLREFVIGRRLQLFTEPDEQMFGPAKWQGDITPEDLQTRWDNIVAFLEKAKSNPKAQEIFQQLLGNAQASLEYAQHDWARLKAGKYVEVAGRGYGSGFEGVFAEIKARVNRLA